MNRNDITSRFPDATDDVVKALLDINSADITKALNKQSNEIQGLNDQITQKDASIKQLTEQHEKELKSLTDKHDKAINDLNDQLKAASDKVVVVDSLTEQVKRLTQDVSDRDATIAATNRTYKLKDALRAKGARNPDVVMPLLNQEKIEEKDGQFVGLDEQLEAVKQSDAYLFNTNVGNQRGGFDGHQDLSNGAKNGNDAVNSALRSAWGRN